MCMVCIREVQRDLKHSAKKLIEDKLHKHNLASGHGFRIFKDCIVTPGDGIILFQGMQDYNADSIKSLEAFHRSWVEEGHTLSARSLELLRPTMRWEDLNLGGYAEMWFSWNPNSKRDAVDAMFRAGEMPTNSVCVEANWQDNPWFPNILEIERQDCLRLEPDQYAHVWDGDYVGIRKGAYYAAQLVKAQNEKRICRVGEDPLMIKRAYIDIGGTGAKSDNFVIWIAQFIGREIRWTNYYEAQGQDFATHVAWLRGQGYTPENTKIFLPHDGETHDKVHKVSYESAFKSVGYKVKVIPNQGRGAASARIDEGRRLFPIMWFDKEKCEGGLEALKHYHEQFDEIRNIGLGPMHDWASHGADAFGLGAVEYKPPTPHGQSKPKVNTSLRSKRMRR